jgi:GNAT superfamily N-acetyltransferase
VVRDARPGDAEVLLELIRGLARYERAEHAVEATSQDLHEALFGPQPGVFALLAETEGQAVAMAVYFWSFSTWTGRHGLYLDDLFVLPEHRSRGIGKALLKVLAARALARDCARLEWAVLDWNQPAIDFYRSLGAVPNEEWTTFRLSGAALTALAEAQAV